MAVLQFPQSYQSAKSKIGTFRELEHFFRLYANSSSKSFSTLPTGTLSFISKEALLKVNGWPQETLTEDARLGLEFLSKNYRMKLSSKKVGKGYMPLTIADLRKQRNRWSYGNAQCFSELIGMEMSWAKKFSACMQLLSWINLLAVPLIGLGFYVGLSVFGIAEEYNYLPLLIVVQLAIYLTGKFFLLTKGMKIKNHKSYLKAFFIHIALSLEMAFACWSAFFLIPQKFIRTNKESSASPAKNLPVFIPVLLAIMVVVLFYQSQYIVGSVTLIIFSIFLFSSLYMFTEFKPLVSERKRNIKTITS